MESAIGYSTPATILLSMYKGLNEISHSSHPSMIGGHFPTHFLYSWLVNTFNACKLDGEASSSLGMVKFAGLCKAKAFQLEGALQFISSMKGFC